VTAQTAGAAAATTAATGTATAGAAADPDARLGPEGALPHFFLVGAPKCATSSLHLLLRRHPDVFMCSPKEPHHFSTDLPGLAEVEGEAAYRALFAGAPAGALRGEASAHYLVSETAAGAIRAAVPEARIVISLRHPVEAARSYYHQLRDGFREDQTGFEAAWALQEARARGERLPPYCPEPGQLQYRRIYSYHDQVARYLDTFGPENVLVLRVERIKADPQGVTGELLRFLGLPPFPGPVELPRSNARREAVVPGLGQFLAAPPAPLRPLVRPVKRALNALGVKPSEIVMRHLSRPAPPAPGGGGGPDGKGDGKGDGGAARAEMLAAFAPDVERLEGLLGWNLEEWRR
jgi:hypothetical protein